LTAKEHKHQGRIRLKKKSRKSIETDSILC
jgi:hypothetical protein